MFKEKVKFRKKSDARNAQKQCNVTSANFKHVFLQNIFESNSLLMNICWKQQ